jgi:uncharacterized membrane protein YfcA
MITPENILLLFGLGLVSGFINVMAGGGSTLLLPAMIFMGMDAPLANGTNRVGILLQNLSAIISFRKEKYSKFKISLKMALFTLPGAITGAFFAINMSNETFKIILSIAMIGVVISMLLPRKKIEIIEDAENQSNFKIFTAMFIIGFYGGFMQVGVGFLLMAALYNILKLRLDFVNMHKVFIVFFFTIPSLLIFAFSGNVNWPLGIAMAAGTSTGAWISAKLAVKKGEKAIKIVMIVAILIMAVRMLGIV